MAKLIIAAAQPTTMALASADIITIKPNVPNMDLLMEARCLMGSATGLISERIQEMEERGEGAEAAYAPLYLLQQSISLLAELERNLHREGHVAANAPMSDQSESELETVAHAACDDLWSVKTLLDAMQKGIGQSGVADVDETVRLTGLASKEVAGVIQKFQPYI